MGRYLQQTEAKTELQQRIAAELRAKASARSKDEGTADPYGNSPDGVDDSQYVRGTKTTSPLAAAWLLIFLVSIGIFVYFVIMMQQ